MAGDESGEDADDRPGTTKNTVSGQSSYVIQARDIQSVHVHGISRRAVLLSITGVVVIVVAALVVAWLRSPSTGPDELTASVDLSFNDQGPWGYASGSADLVGSTLAARLARPSAADDSRTPQAVRAAGGTALAQQTISIDFQAPQQGSVRITDIRPVAVSRRAPLNGTIVWAPPQGVEDSAQAQLDLDDPLPVLRNGSVDESGQHHTAGRYFPGKSIELNSGESAQLELTVFAAAHSYTYELEVRYQENGTARSAIVSNHGQPFGVTGFACTGPGVASYRTAYVLQGDFSLTRDPNPARLAAHGHC